MEYPEILFKPWWLMPWVWLGLALALAAFMWALDNYVASLKEAESEVRHAGVQMAYPHFDIPDRVSETIGRYMDAPIYRNITIAGVIYEFDHIGPVPLGPRSEDERCLAPGVIYVRRHAVC